MESSNTKNTEEKKEFEQAEAIPEVTEKSGDSKYTVDYALGMLEKIMEQMNDRSYEIGSLEEIEDGNSRIVAAEAIKSKEETNRKLIDFYQGIIKDLKPSK